MKAEPFLWLNCHCCSGPPVIKHLPKSTIVGCETKGCPGNLGERRIVGPGPKSYDVQTGTVMGDKCYAVTSRAWNEFTRSHAVMMHAYCEFSNTGISSLH